MIGHEMDSQGHHWLCFCEERIAKSTGSLGALGSHLQPPFDKHVSSSVQTGYVYVNGRIKVKVVISAGTCCCARDALARPCRP